MWVIVDLKHSFSAPKYPIQSSIGHRFQTSKAAISGFPFMILGIFDSSLEDEKMKRYQEGIGEGNSRRYLHME